MIQRADTHSGKRATETRPKDQNVSSQPEEKVKKNNEEMKKGTVDRNGRGEEKRETGKFGG